MEVDAFVVVGSGVVVEVMLKHYYHKMFCSHMRSLYGPVSHVCR